MQKNQEIRSRNAKTRRFVLSKEQKIRNDAKDFAVRFEGVMRDFANG